MTENSPDSDIVTEAKKRFERAKEAYSSTRQLAIADTKFAMGDSDNGWQWPDDIRNGRNTDKKVCLTVNVTAQHCNQIINNIRQNRPSVKVSPVDNGADKKTAEILGGLIRNIQVSSAADDAHDTAAEHSIYGGEGYWRIVMEYESPTSFNQVARIKSCPNPQLVYVDPDAKELDKSDSEWGFVFEDISVQQCKREHPGIDPASWEEDTNGWNNKETVRRADYYYCTYEEKELVQFSDGNGYLMGEQMPEGVYPLTGKDGKPVTRKTRIKKWKWCQLLGGHDKPIGETDWLGEYLPIVSVVGKEVNVDGDIVRKGVVRDLKDPARMVNYAYSETVQTLALQNKIPFLAAAEAITGHEDKWERANTSNDAYLPWNAYDDEGKQLPMPKRQDPAVMPAAQIQLLQLSTEQMRAASGQQNANFGIKSEAASGVGIQRLKVQGETATFHFPDNLARALRYEAKVLIDLIQKYYDTKRVVRILGLDGTEEHATLDPQGPPYQEVPGEQDIEKIFNPMVGKYDVVIDTGPSYQTQRQEAATHMTEVAAKNPAFMQLAGDLYFRAQDFPMADKIAERFEKALPPELQDEKPGEQKIPPEVRQELVQMDQQLQTAVQTLEVMEERLKAAEAQEAAKLEELRIKEAEAAAKAANDKYKAETDRISVVQNAITPEQVQALVMQTLQDVLMTPDVPEGEPLPMQAPPDPMNEAPTEPPDGGFFSPNGEEYPQ